MRGITGAAETTMLPIILILVTSILIRCVSSRNHTVGGITGWDLSSDIQLWSDSVTFQPGDNLVFRYSPVHDVLEVNRKDYKMCRTIDPIITYTDGETVVPLTKEGTRYFICGRLGHCSMGLHLRVPIIAVPSSPAPASNTSSTSPPPPSSTSDHSTPSQSNGNSSSPPPSASNGNSISPSPSPSNGNSFSPPPSPSNGNSSSPTPSASQGTNLRSPPSPSQGTKTHPPPSPSQGTKAHPPPSPSKENNAHPPPPPPPPPAPELPRQHHSESGDDGCKSITSTVVMICVIVYSLIAF